MFLLLSLDASARPVLGVGALGSYSMVTNPDHLVSE
jgi:hypothetical protein